MMEGVEWGVSWGEWVGRGCECMVVRCFGSREGRWVGGESDRGSGGERPDGREVEGSIPLDGGLPGNCQLVS